MIDVKLTVCERLHGKCGVVAMGWRVNILGDNAINSKKPPITRAKGVKMAQDSKMAGKLTENSPEAVSWIHISFSLDKALLK